MYEDLKKLVESGLSPTEATGLVIQYLDSAMGLDGWLDEDQSPGWAALPKEERTRLYDKMRQILGRSY
jgi:hypothetical protein